MIRINRIAHCIDKKRDYKVIVDGKYIGNIDTNSSKTFYLSNGKHKMYLKIDWCKSNEIEFYNLEEEILEFECGNAIPLKGLIKYFNILYIIFFRNKYLWLKEKSN